MAYWEGSAASPSDFNSGGWECAEYGSEPFRAKDLDCPHSKPIISILVEWRHVYHINLVARVEGNVDAIGCAVRSTTGHHLGLAGERPGDLCSVVACSRARTESWRQIEGGGTLMGREVESTVDFTGETAKD
jgi:hypothetical protein